MKAAFTETEVLDFLLNIPDHERTELEAILGFTWDNKTIRRHIFEDPDFDHNFLVIATAKSCGKENYDNQIHGLAFGLQRIWKKGKKDAWVKIVYVRDDMRGKGIGRRILKELEDKLAIAGATKLIFGSSSPFYLMPGLPQSHEPSLQFFLKQGWNSQSTRQNLKIILSHDSQPLLEKIETLQQEKPKYIVKEAQNAEEKELLQFIETEFSKSWAKETQNAIIQKKEKKFVIYLKNAQYQSIGGFVAIGATNPNWLGPMGVKKSLRRQGFGNWLLLVAIHIAQTRNMEHLIVPWVNEANTKFYGDCADARLHTVFWKLEKDLN